MDTPIKVANQQSFSGGAAPTAPAAAAPTPTSSPTSDTSER